MSNNTDKLNKNIATLKEIIRSKTAPGEYDVQTNKGQVNVVPLYKDADIGVVIAEFEMGNESEVMCHNHVGKKEMHLVFVGTAEVNIDDEEQVLSVGDYIMIETDKPHIVRSRMGCKMLCATIPADDGYPQPLVKEIVDATRK
jgi:quercetin dioxygenase-like cupin family protein